MIPRPFQPGQRVSLPDPANSGRSLVFIVDRLGRSLPMSQKIVAGRPGWKYTRAGGSYAILRPDDGTLGTRGKASPAAAVPAEKERPDWEAAFP